MKFLILGSGLMGKAACHFLCRQDNVEKVILGDQDHSRAAYEALHLGNHLVEPAEFNADDENRIAELMGNSTVAIGATSYDHNLRYSRIAIETGCNFIDLGGNHDMVDNQFELHDKAKQKGVTIIPDCGLAPGLTNIISSKVISGFDEVDTLEIRVGGVPVNPKPPLNYFLLFSSRGLINEYVEKSRIIDGGEIKEVDSLAGLESLEFKKPFGKMEAFYTSGGTSTLTKTFKGKIRNLNYKTIRYPGHCELIKFLADLGFTSYEPETINGVSIAPRYVLESVLSKTLQGDGKDASLVRVTSKGKSGEKVTDKTYEIIDYYDEKNSLTSMMRMTSYPAATIAYLIAKGDIKQKGVLCQETSIPFNLFFDELEKWGIKLENG
jgi:lysine 6-dehydrogenase